MNVTEGFFRQAREAPDAPALLTPRATLSYRELARAVSFSAARLRREGLAPGDIAALMLKDEVQHVVASLALARLGAGQISLHASDPPALRAALGRRLKIATTVDAFPEGSPDELKRLPETQFAAADAPQLPFIVKRTSGTTADRPRLAMLTQGMAHDWLHDFDDSLPEGSGHRLFSAVPLTFTGSVHSMLRCFTRGGCLAVPGLDSTTDEVTEFILRHQVDYIACGPVHAAALAKMSRARKTAPLFPHIKAMRISTTLIPEGLRKLVRALVTPNLFIFYGMTEVGSLTLASPELVARVPGVVGMPVRGVQIEVVDADGRALPPGQRGIVRARSASMIRGYLDDPEESARVFRDGWFHSGDLAEFTAEGALVHHGRADDLMIFDGMNIHPGEIESAFLKHPAVAEAAAFSLKSVVRGDKLRVALVLREKVSKESLAAHGLKWLGKRRPQDFLILDELPRNAAGKILRRELEVLWKKSVSP